MKRRSLSSGDNLVRPNCMGSSDVVPGGPVSAVGLLDGGAKANRLISGG